MDKFLTVKKPSTTGRVANDDKQKDRQKLRYNPYGVSKADERGFEAWKDRKRTERIVAPLLEASGSKPSGAALTKHLLNTLGEEGNPITNSDLYERSDHIQSVATGHQRGEGRHRSVQRVFIKSRNTKLAEQLQERSSGDSSATVLRNVNVYIGGYMANTTDIEMKRIVHLAGGQTLRTASGATHILTSQQLSGSKTHKLLTTKSRIKVHVVRPEWVTDSIAAGKRLPEREYEVITRQANLTISDMLGAGSSRSA